MRFVLLLILFLSGCNYYHVDREIEYGWFTVIQHNTDKPSIRNNLNQTLTIEIYVPDADGWEWYKAKTLVLKAHETGQGINFFEYEWIVYIFWVYKDHPAWMRGNEGN